MTLKELRAATELLDRGIEIKLAYITEENGRRVVNRIGTSGVYINYEENLIELVSGETQGESYILDEAQEG